MDQLPLFSPENTLALSVTELTRHIRERLESDDGLQNIRVIGEVSNATQARSGHFYFTLKDAGASLRCVMWRNQVARLRFLPGDGDQVEVHGSISVYEAGGQYQLYADHIDAAGQGLLYQEFLRLKAALEAEGLFDPSRKLPLPAWPHAIGVVTSPTGAALQDILNTLRRRYPLAEVILAPTAVQGLEAPSGIVRGLQQLGSSIRPDVILLARGGGSMEDLWAFNDERVVRAIVACPIPIITGIGHETDFTLADFAADHRAPTPTAAAELAVPDKEDLERMLQEKTHRLDQHMRAVLAEMRFRLSDATSHLLRRSPEVRLRNDIQKLDERVIRLQHTISRRLEIDQLRISSLQSRLEAANPLAVLKRGFSIVTRQSDGVLVRSVAQVEHGDLLHIQVQDGSYNASVTKDDL